MGFEARGEKTLQFSWEPWRVLVYLISKESYQKRVQRGGEDDRFRMEGKSLNFVLICGIPIERCVGLVLLALDEQQRLIWSWLFLGLVLGFTAKEKFYD